MGSVTVAVVGVCCNRIAIYADGFESAAQVVAVVIQAGCTFDGFLLLADSADEVILITHMILRRAVILRTVVIYFTIVVITYCAGAIVNIGVTD